MKTNNFSIAILFSLFILSSCQDGIKEYDATGSFEAIERVISAEANGVIETLNIQEGQIIAKGDTLGNIDVSNLILQAEQMKASINAIGAKKNEAGPQILVLQAQIKAQESQIATLNQQSVNIENEINRFQQLVKANAAPQKQLDDLKAQQLVLAEQLKGANKQKEVLSAQIKSTKQNVALQNTAILSEEAPNLVGLELIQKQINDGIIISQHQGTITAQMAYDGEFITIGRPLYKVADLNEINLRAYITGDQLPQVKLNQKVTVRTDDGNGGFNEREGTIIWISDNAEFTPKTIQTKNERANLVYAIKVKVTNDGSYKMGMYGELKF